MTDLSSVFIRCLEFTKVRLFFLRAAGRDAKLWVLCKNSENSGTAKRPDLPIKPLEEREAGCVFGVCMQSLRFGSLAPCPSRQIPVKSLFGGKNYMLDELSGSLQRCVSGAVCRSRR